MELRYKTNKLKRQCENPRIAQKDYGIDIKNKLTQRIEELKAAKNLADISFLPAARLHRLQGNRSHEYAVDLAHPFRLIIKPILESDGDINKLEIIDVVRIEGVEDYHGKQKR